MCLTNHTSAFLLHDVRVVKNVACLSSLYVINPLSNPARDGRLLCNLLPEARASFHPAVL